MVLQFSTMCVTSIDMNSFLSICVKFKPACVENILSATYLTPSTLPRLRRVRISNILYLIYYEIFRMTICPYLKCSYIYTAICIHHSYPRTWFPGTTFINFQAWMQHFRQIEQGQSLPSTLICITEVFEFTTIIFILESERYGYRPTQLHIGELNHCNGQVFQNIDMKSVY